MNIPEMRGPIMITVALLPVLVITMAQNTDLLSRERLVENCR